MHADYASLALLLMGQATFATWTTEIKNALQSVATNPVIAERNRTDYADDCGWLEVGSASEFLIQPGTIESPDTVRAKETCKGLDTEATLFTQRLTPRE